jgi:hypothetical protein
MIPLRSLLLLLPLAFAPIVPAATPAARPPAAAAAQPQPFRAEYEVLRNGEPLGRGTITLRQLEGERWEYLSRTEGTEGLAGLAGAEIVERSELRFAGGRLESLGYRFKQEIGWKERERSVAFEPQRGRIVSRDRDEEHVFGFAAGVLDRQAVVLALALDLAAGKRDELSYTVVDRDELGEQRYGVRGEETIQTRAGAKRTLKIERIRAGAHARTTTSWLCPDEGYLPVRVLQKEPDGDSFEMRLVSLQR